jgi:C-3',4' desaturase CrtD
MTRVVVVGAGVGGLTTAARLSRAGLDVTVLEAHVYAGGCAGTFFHQGYRFDAGATLAAGFYPGGPMDLVAQEVGIEDWPVRTDELAMVVHLPGGTSVPRYAGEQRWQARRQAFGPESLEFWQWQEDTADALWDLALRLPAWPPQSVGDAGNLVASGLAWLAADAKHRVNPRLALDALRPVGAYLRNASSSLRHFVDAQLLISAQTTSDQANALYGASALDLPRRGAAHAEGGMGAISATLVDAVRSNGGQVLFRQQATRIVAERGRPVAVETNKGLSVPADIVVANLTPWNLAQLMGENAPRRLARLPGMPDHLWGAFMLYVGLDGALVPDDFALHHQLVTPAVAGGEPMGEGNTVFMSLSPDWDDVRAPDGHRALTMSSHTDLGKWWALYNDDRATYEARRDNYAERMLNAASGVLPGLREATALVLPGTPVTFQRFTRRLRGWVGGYPQSSLFQGWGPKLADGLWLVGDSIFPGQSVPAVALGGLRVARQVLAEAGQMANSRETGQLSTSGQTQSGGAVSTTAHSSLSSKETGGE